MTAHDPVERPLIFTGMRTCVTLARGAPRARPTSGLFSLRGVRFRFAGFNRLEGGLRRFIGAGVWPFGTAMSCRRVAASPADIGPADAAAFRPAIARAATTTATVASLRVSDRTKEHRHHDGEKDRLTIEPAFSSHNVGRMPISLSECKKVSRLQSPIFNPNASPAHG